MTSLQPFIKPMRTLLLAGVAVIALGGCALNRMPSPDYSGMPAAQSQQSLAELTARFTGDVRGFADEHLLRLPQVVRLDLQSAEFLI